MSLLSLRVASGRRGLLAPGRSCWERVPCVAAAAAAAAVSSPLLQQQRFLHLHEYQSMELMQKYSIGIPAFRVARSREEAYAAARQLQQQLQQQRQEGSAAPLIVKAQVLAGGRGLGHFKETRFKGGVHMCGSAEEAAELAGEMLSKTLVTKQTGEQGKPCNMVLICERFNVNREMYLAMLLDRGSRGIMLIGSAKGGTSIEDIAAKYPEAIVKVPIDLDRGVDEEVISKFAEGMGLASSPSHEEQVASLLKNLYRLFRERDCLLVEVNPLVETRPHTSSSGSELRVCDAKLAFDDNAAFRQQRLFALRDESQEDPGELEAEKEGLNYIKLQGEIGCMVNGAGLAMASMDLIKLKGMSPANFLDVGGGADEKRIVAALSIIQRDKDVKAVLINIFGGIIRCDLIARGLLTAIKQTGFDKPIVIRLEGTNKAEAQRLLEAGVDDPRFKGLRIQAVSGFDEAAEAVVRLAKGL
ncbi:hypothetical protein Esti_001529 [Eimeria stiedai]